MLRITLSSGLVYLQSNNNNDTFGVAQYSLTLNTYDPFYNVLCCLAQLIDILYVRLLHNINFSSIKDINNNFS